MTMKRSVALAALLAVGLSSTTGFAAKRNAPEESISNSKMMRDTVWTAAKFVALQQYITRVAPKLDSSFNTVDSTNGQATKFLMDAVVGGLFLASMKDYFTDLRAWSWDSFGAPIASQLPEPVRSILCD